MRNLESERKKHIHSASYIANTPPSTPSPLTVSQGKRKRKERSPSEQWAKLPAHLEPIEANKCRRFLGYRREKRRVLGGKGGDSLGDLGGSVILGGVLGDEGHGETRDVGRGHGSSANGACAFVACLDPSAGDVATRGEEVDACLFPSALAIKWGRWGGERGIIHL